MKLATPREWSRLPAHIQEMGLFRLRSIRRFEEIVKHSRPGDQCRLARQFVRDLGAAERRQVVSYTNFNRWLALCRDGRAVEIIGRRWARRCRGQAAAVNGKRVDDMDASEIADVLSAIGQRVVVLEGIGS